MIDGLPETKTSYPLFASLEKRLNLQINYIDSQIGTESVFDILFFRAGENGDQKFIEIALNNFQRITAKTKIDSAEGLFICADKIRQCQLLLAANILMPKTFIINNLVQLKNLNLSFPYIVKYRMGSGGKAVFKIENVEMADKVVQEGIDLDGQVIAQEYIVMSKPQDHRIYILGNECPKGVVRIAKKGDFRSNLRQGGTKQNFTPPDMLIKTGVKICDLLKMDVAAIDFLKYRDDYYFLEINDSFGMKGDVELAEELLKFCIKKFLKTSENAK